MFLPTGQSTRYDPEYDLEEVRFHSGGRPVPPVGAKNLSPDVRYPPDVAHGRHRTPACETGHLYKIKTGVDR